MTHPSEEDLILLHYGETEAAAELEAHLVGCAVCRQAQSALRITLEAALAPVPERGADYGHQVWQRLAPRLPQPRAALRLPQRSWLAALAAAAALVVAFQAGRQWPQVQPSPPAASAPVRERILLVAVGDHLRRSQMVLIELVNAGDQGPLDISAERELAQNLVANNRLYRQTATSAGETAVVNVLDDLERVLIEIANGPETLSAHAVQELRKRIEAKGILFKVKVLGSQVRERETEAARARGAVRS